MVAAMKSASSIVKRSVVIRGLKTSVSLEDEFWSGLKRIAEERETTLANLVEEIADKRANGNLSSAIRIHVLRHYRERCGAG